MGRKILTPEQIKSIEAMSAMRIPHEKMAIILGISKETLERMAKRNKEVKDALDKGLARGTNKVFQTAFQMATGYTRTVEVEWYNPKSGRWETRTKREDVPPDVNMLRFWLKTQEGWRETDRLEITGAGGGSLKIEDMTAEARREKLKHYEALERKLASARQLIEAARDVTPEHIPDDAESVEHIPNSEPEDG